MAVLPLESSFTYGPVRSRRLGRSLGINVLPLERKICSFNCVYCHYGVTIGATLTPEASDFPGVEPVLRAVELALRTCPEVDALTFSGNGEPTLHPYFRELVFGVRRLRDRLAPHAQLTLFSNATTLDLPKTQAALAWIDAPIMKLDAGDPSAFAGINRPAPGVSLETILTGLRALPNIIVQSLLLEGPVSNVHGAAFEAWVAALLEIRPRQVQIYSTDYPTAEENLVQVPAFRLRHIAETVTRRTSLDVRAFWLNP
ncbi:MAG: radical SAM protein [Anaerolineae bacterium]|nr:radical SAM protein [Anaerolineae bacterium]